ncbi:hypothetical protein N305_00793, partial [Manacus vitellinus]
PALSLPTGDPGSAGAGSQQITAPGVAEPHHAARTAGPGAATHPPAETCHQTPLPCWHELDRAYSPVLSPVSCRDIPAPALHKPQRQGLQSLSHRDLPLPAQH